MFLNSLQTSSVFEKFALIMLSFFSFIQHISLSKIKSPRRHYSKATLNMDYMIFLHHLPLVLFCLQAQFLLVHFGIPDLAILQLPFFLRLQPLVFLLFHFSLIKCLHVQFFIWLNLLLYIFLCLLLMQLNPQLLFTQTYRVLSLIPQQQVLGIS